MKKHIALLLVISFIVASCATYERGEGINLSPDQKPGVKLIIQKKDGQQVSGELIAVKMNSLLLWDSGLGIDISVAIEDVTVITIVKKSMALGGAVLGYLTVSVALSVISYATDPESFTDPEGGGSLVLMAIFGIPGIFLGGGVGAILGTDEKIQFEGMAPEVLEKTLDHLRKKARISNSQ